MTIHGRVIAVTDEIEGSFLEAAISAGATTLTLEDASAFFETGGTLLLSDDGEDESVEYSAADWEANTITCTATINAWGIYSRVQPVPAVSYRMAQVQPDDSELGVIRARVPYALTAQLPEGIRVDEDREEVILELVRGFWQVYDIPGGTPVVDGAYVALTAEQVTAENIAAGAITADKLDADLVISTSIRTGTTGQRVEIDEDGVRLISDSDNVLVDLPTLDGADAVFEGEIVATDLTVDNATFRGATNYDVGSSMTLAGTQVPPATAPVLTQAVSSRTWGEFPGFQTNYHSPWLWTDEDAVIGITGASGEEQWFVRNSAATGAHEDYSSVDTPAEYYVHSVVWHEEQGYWIGTARKTASGDWYFLVWADSSAAPQLPGAYQTRFGPISTYKDAYPIITKADGSGTIYIGYGNAAGWCYIETRTWAGSPLATSPTLTNASYDFAPPESTEHGLVALWRGSGDFGATRYVIRGRNGSNVLNTNYTVYSEAGATLTEQSSSAWEASTGWGLWYDDAAFHEVLRTTGDEWYTYAGWTETADNQYQVAYTWFDTTGTEHETALSPRAEIAHKSRRFLTVTWPSIPTGGAEDPDSVRVYMIDNDTDQGDTFANYKLQGEVASPAQSTTLSSYSTSTAGSKAADFTAGTAAYIASGSGSLGVYGDGKLHLPSFATGVAPSSTESALYYDTTDDVVKVRNASVYAPLQGFIGAKALKGANQTITAANTDVITWSSTSYDVGTFFDNANDRFTVPSGYAGYYHVMVVLEYAAYAANHGGRRVVQLRNNTTVVATTSNTTHDRQTTDIIDTVLNLAVGDDLDVRVNAVTVNTVVNGTGTEIDTYFILHYLGPGAAN